MQLSAPSQLVPCFQQVREIRKGEFSMMYMFHRAYNDSLVYIEASTFDVRKRWIVHLSSDGQQLWQYDLPDGVRQFEMVNGKDLLFLSVQSNSIAIISLDTHKVIVVKHKFLSNVKNLSPTVFIFSQSRLFCIVQKELSNDKVITYFSLKNIHQSSQSVAQCKVKYQFDCHSVKLNNHSKIGFFLCSLESINFICAVQLSEQFKEMRRQMDKKQVIKKGVFTCICYQFRTNQLLALITQFNFFKEVIPSQLKIIDISDQKEWQMKNCFLLLNGQVYQQNLNFFQMIPLPDYFVLRGVKDEHNIAVFVDYESRKVLSIEKQEREVISFYGLEWEANVLMKVSKKDKNSMEITVKRYALKKDIYLSFLLGLNEDWDDDFLGDAIELLT